MTGVLCTVYGAQLYLYNITDHIFYFSTAYTNWVSFKYIIRSITDK